MNIPKRKRILIALGAVVVALLAIGTALYFLLRFATNWYDHNTIEFKSPVVVEFNKPVTVKDREFLTPTSIEIVVETLPSLDNLTPIEEYICEKWGVYDCKTALAVARAESGMKEDAININTNNTIDVGIFQINSIHFTKDGCSLKEVVDAHSNVDCAYTIWEASGWNPWVVFNNGNFINHLEE